MDIIADLHIHSRYARACSKQITVKNLEKYAREKGITVMGTGDFQHPEWQPELKKELTERSEGIYETATGYPFILQTEISLMYSQGGKGRRVHHVVLAPSMDVVDQVTEALKKKGRIDYDGRPIFGMSSIDFTEMLMGISKDIEIIPAHAWTPWFGVFGSKSGFDSLKECFGDQSKYIHAIETGISSDPAMNWRLSQLDNIQLVSFSDMHSFWPWRIGREATVFEAKELTYKNILHSIRTGEGLKETIEFFPEEGKYHLDGHRKCGVCFTPQESKKANNTCPECKRPLTLGVLHRVEQLADRPEGEKPKNAKPFRNLVPISELIAKAIGSPVASKKTWAIYYDLLKKFGSEYGIVLHASDEDIKKTVPEKVAELILKVKNQQLSFNPGYDGEYGELKV